MNILGLLKEFEGIIGSLLGSVGTLIITDVLRKKGKLNIYLMDFSGNYWYDNNSIYGRSSTKKENSKMEGYQFITVIDVYNSSELPKIMRNIKLVIFEQNKTICELVVKDEETRRMTQAHYITADDASIYNIGGKETYSLKLGASLPSDIAEKLKNGLTLKLRYKDEKDKDKYFEIFNGKIEEENIKNDI